MIGCAIALAYVDNDMKFESSYSGMTSWDKLPFKDAGKFLYETYRLIFRDIAEQFGDFKIKGELIWINGMEDQGKVTPVGASYLTEKFGSFGGIIVFEIFKIKNNELGRFDEDSENTIMEMIQDMNNDEFSFYLSQNIILNQNVNFTINPDELLEIINKPEFNKERFSKKEDAKILEEISKIQENIVQQLSLIVDRSKGAFSAEGDLIEGIVLKINSSGNQYGIFSNGYKDMKHKYWEQFEKINEIYNEFLKKVFGKSQRRFIEKDINSGKSFKKKYDELINDYAEKITYEIEKLKNTDIPKAVKSTQLSMGNNTAIKITSKLSYEDFLKKYIIRGENNE